MPWTLDDYPNSWKNFEPLERKKAIDIGNALLKDGYDEDVTQHKKDKDARPQLNDNDVEVYQEDDKWKVRTYGAKRAADEYDTKEKAVQRAEEIAKNRNTQVHVKS